MPIAKIAKQLLRDARARRRIDRGIRILTYHGVVERRADANVEASFHLLHHFRAHVSYLRRCRVVSLGQLDDVLAERRVWPTVAITFDDGFRNNLTAAEILQEANLPATIFIATENVDRQQTIWPTLLRLALARGSARRLTIAGKAYDLDIASDVFSKVRDDFKAAPAFARIAMWSELQAQLRPGELGDLVASFPSLEMMSWDEVRSLRRSGFEIGSHGMLHELHHAHQPIDVRVRELVDSKTKIESSLAHSCDHFAFPNGTFTTSSPTEVRHAGYRRGYTMISRAATASDDPMLMPRIVPGAGVEKLISSLVFGN